MGLSHRVDVVYLDDLVLDLKAQLIDLLVKEEES